MSDSLTLTYGLGVPVLAALTSRWSRTRVLVFALFGFCLANIGSALAPTFPLLVLTRMLAGACAATHSPLAYATSTQLAPPEKRGRALARLLLIAGLGFVGGSWISGGVVDRFGAMRALVVSLLVLTIILAIFSWATTGLLTGLPALLLWVGAGSSIFMPQQHRLLSLAPTHVNVILALNNAALYLGTAGGAILGGVALHVLPITRLGWVGESSSLLALLLLLLSLRLSAHAAHVQE